MLSKFNPNEYRQRLNLALGGGVTNTTPVIGSGPQVAPPAQINTQHLPQRQPTQFEPPQEAGRASGGGPNLMSAASALVPGGGAGLNLPAGVQGINPGAPAPGQPSSGNSAPKIETVPPNWKPNVDESKMKSAKTIEDVFEAVPEKDQETYLDWWEAKNGEINQHYQQGMRALGKRPDPNRKMDRKEMFFLLSRMAMNFMRAQAQTAPGEGIGGALKYGVAGGLQDYENSRMQEVADYDSGVANLSAAREKALKSIGHRGDAMEAQSDIDHRKAQTDETRTRKGNLERMGPLEEKKTSAEIGRINAQAGEARARAANLGAGEDDAYAREEERDARSGKSERRMYQDAQKAARDQLGTRAQYEQSAYERGAKEKPYEEALEELANQIFDRYKGFGARRDVNFMREQRGDDFDDNDPFGIRK